jgi:hypothetical protein
MYLCVVLPQTSLRTQNTWREYGSDLEKFSLSGLNFLHLNFLSHNDPALVRHPGPLFYLKTQNMTYVRLWSQQLTRTS